MASRNIADLDKELQPLASRFINMANVALASHNASVIITCTYRSNAEQAILYAQGRTVPGKKVTNAGPGQSEHNKVDKNGRPASRAFDVAILDNGKLNWNLDDVVWQIVGDIGERLGLEWAGRWKKFKEGPHFQLKNS